MTDTAIHTTDELMDLEYSRHHRRKIIEDLTANGTPTNTRELELLLGALKDGEDRVFKSTKIRQSSKRDEDTGEVNRAMVAAMLNNIPSIPSEIEEGEYADIPALPGGVEKEQTFVEGELDFPEETS